MLFQSIYFYFFVTLLKSKYKKERVFFFKCRTQNATCKRDTAFKNCPRVYLTHLKSSKNYTVIFMENKYIHWYLLFLHIHSEDSVTVLRHQQCVNISTGCFLSLLIEHLRPVKFYQFTERWKFPEFVSR